MSALELITATSPGSGTSPKTQAVSCTGSKKALGGGGSINSGGDPDIAIQTSQPTGSPLPTGWTVTAVETDSGGTWSVTAYVICATVP